MLRDAKAGLVPAGGNQLPPVLEGAASLTAACPSLEGRSGDGWMRLPGKRQKATIHSHYRAAGPLPRCPRPPPARCSSRQQAMPILGFDLPCQMLAQRLLAVRPEIIVEIPEPRFQHPHGNPDLGCSGAQPLCRA
jgi:hypothetical protein